MKLHRSRTDMFAQLMHKASRLMAKDS